MARNKRLESWLWFSLISACGADPAAPPWNANSAGSASVPYGAAGSSGSGGAGAPLSLWCGVKQTLDTRCVACHDEQKAGGAPMPLTSYAATQAAAVSDATKKVYQLVGSRVHDTTNPMPPRQKLTADELSGIDAWVAAGGVAGDDPSCGGTKITPPATNDWPANCDATYTILARSEADSTKGYTVPAGQELHPNLSVPAPWGNQQMQAIAFRPVTDNRKVLHHWILYGPKREFLVGWAPGSDQSTLPPDVGMNLAGGTLTLNMHYNNLLGTQTEQDRSGVEICALKPENFRKNTSGVHTGFSQLAFRIPAHAMNYAVTGQCTVTASTPVTLFSVSPHAHKLARHMTFSVQKASGQSIMLHDGSFDFNEQQAYALSPMVQLATGDKVTTTCFYDNTTNQVVRFGENTDNEMCFNFAAYYPMGALDCGFAFGGGQL